MEKVIKFCIMGFFALLLVCITISIFVEFPAINFGAFVWLVVVAFFGAYAWHTMN